MSLHTVGTMKVIRIEFNKLSISDKIELLAQLAGDTPNEHNVQDKHVALTTTYLMNMISNYEILGNGHTREEEIEHLKKYIDRWLTGKGLSI